MDIFYTLRHLETWQLGLLGVVVLVSILGVWAQKRAEAEEKQRLRELLGGTFPELRKDSTKLVDKPDNVIKIGFHSWAEEVQRGRTRVEVQIYESFLITDDKDFVDLQREEDKPIVENNARWLAERWGIPFESRGGTSIV